LSTQNEVPAINLNATGMATIWLHVVRDAQGRVTSASTDFDVTYRFPSEASFTGLHIHKGAAGVNGPVTIDSGMRATDGLVSNADQRIRLQGFTATDNAAGLDTANGMLTDPAGFYVNLHTTANPGGVIRGQLMRAEMVVLVAQLSPANEVPAIPINASGMGSIVALATRDASGNLNSGLVSFDAAYTGFPENTTFTGYHIHDGVRGINGPVTINTGMTATSGAGTATGSGALHYDVEVPMATPAAVNTLNGLFTNPDGFYMNLHTTVYTGGAIRSQLRRTDRLHFPVNLSPVNEVPAINSAASGPASFTAYTVRNAQGAVEGGVVIFDVNYRVPAGTTFTGLHIHNGAAGVNGPVTIDSGLNARVPVEAATGTGNVYRIVTAATPAALAALNTVAMTPELHYMNIHTTVNPGGLMREQLLTTTPKAPVVDAVISAVSDPSLRRFAPGGLATIFGSDLLRVLGDSYGSSHGVRLPPSYNGTTVRISGVDAPIVQSGEGFLVIQIPTELGPGTHALTVWNATGVSAATDIQVMAAAPAVFFDTQAGIFADANGLLTGRPGAAARKGQTIMVWSTGLPIVGVDTARINTGPRDTGAVTATIDGRAARVMSSVTAPGFVGMYQTSVVVPADTRTGTVPLTLSAGGATSNTVNLVVQ